MSIERLDRSQESFDLKKAVLAGLIKSRFWTTARRIEPQAVVGRITVFGTLLFFGLFVGMLYLQKRLPNTEYFILTLGPLGFWYVFQQNLGWLRRVGKNKLLSGLCGLVASLIGVGCKVLTDQQIRGLTQSDPSLFPSAQQAITALNIINIILLGIGGIMLLSAMLQLYKEYFVAYGRMFLSFLSLTEMLGLSSRTCTFRAAESFLSKMWGGVFFLSLVAILNAGFAEVGGKQVDLAEWLLLRSSFIPNDLGPAGSDRVCANLIPDTLVFPFSTKESFPSRVVTAQPITTGPDRLGRSYTYYIVTCAKPTDSGAFLGTDHGN
jgi:hypothetical protein